MHFLISQRTSPQSTILLGNSVQRILIIYTKAIKELHNANLVTYGLTLISEQTIGTEFETASLTILIWNFTLIMEQIKDHVKFLTQLVFEPKRKTILLLKNSSEEQIVLLIELILNFETFDSNTCSPRIKKHLNTLRKVKWKLTTAKNVFIKNLIHLRPVISVIIVALLESEICEIL